MSFSIDQISTLTIRAKCAFIIGIADSIVDEIKQDKDGYKIAKEAIDKSWQWIEGKNISGDSLAEYVDSPTEKDLGVRETLYEDDGMISAIASITLAIGYTARQAYNVVGAKVMSSPIWEIDDNSIEEIIEHASGAKCYREEVVESWGLYLQKYKATKKQDLGPIIKKTECETILNRK